MLFVNFDSSIDHHSLQALIEKNSLSIKTILDFANILKKESIDEKINLIRPVELDVELKLNKFAVENYIKEISIFGKYKLRNGKRIRDIKIGGFPVYWLTSISIKHSQNSILKNIYYLQEIIESRALSLEQYRNIIICVPSKEEYFSPFIISKVAKLFPRAVTVLSTVKFIPIYADWKPFSIIKQSVKSYFKALRKKSAFLQITKGPDSDFSIITFPSTTWNQDINNDFVFKDLKEFCDKYGTTSYLPFFKNLEEFNNLQRWPNQWDVKFLKQFPNPIEFITYCLNHIRFFYIIKKVQFKNDMELYDEIIKRELYDIAYLNNNLLLNYMWFKKYFKKEIVSNRKLFYQDEFYESGRIISAAALDAKNSNLINYGVQHGLFFSGHTVYSITDNEIKGRNSMPIPKKFIVWGDYFKRLFLACNDMKEEYVISAGNLKYLNRIRNNSGLDCKIKNQLLWCTTVSNDNVQMFNIISKFLITNTSYTVIVRCHPLFDLKSEISLMFESIGFKRFQFSIEKDIFKDICCCNIVIASGASTTFIDGLIAGTPVINIMLPDHVTEKIEDELLFNVRTTQEFFNCIKIIENRKMVNNSTVINEMLASDDNWKKILLN